MNAPMGGPAPARAQDDTAGQLVFLRKLQAITNRIHATARVEEIMLDLGLDFCDLLDCDRFTLYAMAPDKEHIVSRVKTGLTTVRELRLPLGPASIAGYVAQTRQAVAIADVYDEAELRRISPALQFQRGVDQRTGYRTRQMLVAPLQDALGELLGVVQFINHRGGGPFPARAMEAVRQLGETLSVALSQRLAPQRMRGKYDALVREALLSQEELEQAGRRARERDADLEDVLEGELHVRRAAIGAALAAWFKLPYEPFRPERVKPVDLLRNLKAQYVEENGWLPLEDGPNGLVVLAVDPERTAASRIVGQLFPKAKVSWRVTTRAEFRQTLEAFFGTGSSSETVGELLSGLEDDEDHESSADISEAVENELVRLLNKVIVDAYRQGVSDIHIEPQPGKGKTGIRFRKDGVLVPYIEIPSSYRNALVARIKIMCDLDISERRKPQDGKIRFRKYGPLDIELRVATIPSAGGVEDVVMRILQAGEPIPLSKLGLSDYNLGRLLPAIEKPYGLFFVCGPTGSGKTTTLHSILHHLNTPETKIWTAEDPVEITQKGLRQVQVNRKAGLDFASVMRAFLRADPDVIMVGEMRDKETVSTGIEASLTGHLVFATLHTNSAPESIVRLLDMGMDPFNFADALLGILAQRLARRLCTTCRQSYSPDPAEVEALLAEYCEDLRGTASHQADPEAARNRILEAWRQRHGDADGRFTLYRAVGCDDCNKGYRGRIGLHELMLGSDAVKRLLVEHSRVSSLLDAALDDGMLTLKMDGIEKVFAGLTDIKMVRAVCIR
ncbi:GspE/PulE family protein [Massilia sp. IC2-476]|uniref:GspE/PulE family protein n=1 Tax=Massilia sp. IC2-476 TaxID=2887199 RepID=UPI001D102118|nr:GspE/PulE family protein [Massilia sp. IC2-476]MCC2970573.1 GspE/PulE family protein [Massilia sp. IC2-476]